MSNTTENKPVDDEKAKKLPAIKDIASEVDSFKREQGWEEPKKDSKKVKNKTIKIGNNKNIKKVKNITPTSNVLKSTFTAIVSNKPQRSRPIHEHAIVDWSLREHEHASFDDDFEDDVYRLSKADVAKRKREEELNDRRKKRDASIRDIDIYNALVINMNKEIIYPLYHGFGWMLIAKTTKLNIVRSVNSHGFQPYEQTKEEKNCIVTLLIWDGDGPEYGTIADGIKGIGCSSVFISRADDVKEILRKL